MNWLIDGQQRVLTLSKIMNGDEGIDVVFHPEQQQFRLANAATRKDANWVRVAELLDDDMYRQLSATSTAVGALTGGRRFQRCEGSWMLDLRPNGRS